MPTTATQQLKPYSILFIDLNMDDPLLGLPIFGTSGTDVKVFLSLNITPNNASVCPMILDSTNYEKYKNGESYQKWRYDGNTSIGAGLSDVFTINSKEKYYIALFNKEQYPVDFTITISPTV
jgi:hypothetical protein